MIKFPTLIVSSFLVLFIISACSPKETQSREPQSMSVFLKPFVGLYAKVQFRRDLLGAHAELPIAPTTSSINGAETSISGRIKGVNDEGVLLDSGQRIYWVPKESILLLDIKK